MSERQRRVERLLRERVLPLERRLAREPRWAEVYERMELAEAGRAASEKKRLASEKQLLASESRRRAAELALARLQQLEGARAARAEAEASELAERRAAERTLREREARARDWERERRRRERERARKREVLVDKAFASGYAAAKRAVEIKL